MNVLLLGPVVIQPVLEEEEMVIVMEQGPAIRMTEPKILVQVMFVLVQVPRLLFLLQTTVTMMRTVIMEIVLPPNGGLPVMVRVLAEPPPITLMLPAAQFMLMRERL